MAKPRAKPTPAPTGEPAHEPVGPARRVRLALRYAFLLATFVIILHYNVVRPYFLDGQEMDVVAADAPPWLRPPAAAYHALVDGGSRAGLALVWRMYSPVPQRVFHTELTAQDASGRWLPLSSPGLPREHREQRSLLAALFWDFKRARINDNYFIYRYETWLPLHYVAVSRQRIVRELGWVPRAVRVRVQSAPIPPPSQKGDWQPDRAVFDRIVWEEVYR